MFHFIALVVSASLALWIATRVARRPAVGSRWFQWLSVAIAVWSLAGAGHALADGVGAKLLWSKLQYLGIASVAPLWLLFTAEYANVAWFRAARVNRARIAMLWVVPILTIVLAATNEWHRLVWTSVALNADGTALYAHGWWFWAAASYNYALVLAGTLLIARVLRQSPPQLRTQFLTLLLAALIPWVGNILYVSGAVRAIDVTPLAFTLSNVLFAWALYRAHLFDLVPVARDLVIDSLSDAMIVIDPSRRILDMNAAARELAERKAGRRTPKRRLIGRDVGAVFPLLHDVPLEAASMLSMSAIVTSGGDPAFFDVRVLPVVLRGRALDAWVLLLRDVTDQRRAAAEHDLLQQRIQEQQRRESLSILAGGLAHDFNNLLAGIVGNADLLALQVPASSSMGTSVGAILLGAQRAADLVSKMLAYAGERHGSASRIDVDALTRDLLDLLRTSAGRHCTITYAGQRAVIDADPTQFRQVAMNLIINAAEAVSDSGQVSITTGVQTLTASDLAGMRFGQDSEPGEFAFLAVEDDGVGMDERTLQRVFQPFFTTKASGHGLGLAAVQGIMLGHRGARRVDTQPGRGSRVCVWFPIGTTPQGEGEELAAPGSTQVSAIAQEEAVL
jgi:signal transduction histidine kinase